MASWLSLELAWHGVVLFKLKEQPHARPVMISTVPYVAPMCRLPHSATDGGDAARKEERTECEWDERKEALSVVRAHRPFGSLGVALWCVCDCVVLLAVCCVRHWSFTVSCS